MMKLFSTATVEREKEEGKHAADRQDAGPGIGSDGIVMAGDRFGGSLSSTTAAEFFL